MREFRWEVEIEAGNESQIVRGMRMKRKEKKVGNHWRKNEEARTHHMAELRALLNYV